jgi:glycosyltransferase involved in cell wall biosynthesis
LKFKDLYFDIPKAHSIKNLITGLLSDLDEEIYEPSYSRTHRNYYVFNRDPYILTVLESINDLQIFSEVIGKNKNVIYLKFFSWTLFDRPGILERTIFDYKNQIKKFPKHRIIFLLNTLEEYHYFKSKGINCKFINHNAFVDPNIFKPLNSIKEYDIIYNGRLEMVKRHYLLKSCENISLLSASILRSDQTKIKYLNYLKKIIPNADLLNFDSPIKLNRLSSFENIPILDPKGVSDAINKAKIGVILSYKEGACYASMEYLLSGVPIVSTANIGGRDIFFDKRFCKTSLSNSFSIKKSVSKLLNDNISSDFIRSVTLNKIQLHINKMKNLLEEIFLEYGVLNANIDEVWEKIYLNKMLKTSQKFPENFIRDI